MKFCSNCGKAIDDYTLFCPNCGANQATGVGGNNSDYYDPKAHEGNVWMAILCFFIPLLGLLLWVIKRYERPGLADSCAKGALASVCASTPLIGLVLYFVWKESRPDYAKVCIIAAVIGFVVNTVFSIVFQLFFEEAFYEILEEFMEENDLYGDPDDGYYGSGIYFEATPLPDAA